MHFGLGVLRLSPTEFWSMTPRELAAAAGLTRQHLSISRFDFTHLQSRFPDKGTRHE